MQKRCKFRVAKTRFQNCSKTGFGAVLGSILERFCMVMDLLWTLLGTSDTIFECLTSSLYKVLVEAGLQEAFGIDFG